MVGGLLAKCQHWDCVSDSFFLSCHKSHLEHLVSQIDEFLDGLFVMTQVSDVDLQKRFPVIQIDSMCQVASVCRSLAWRVDLESLHCKRLNMFHHNSTLLREIILNLS